ncbi:MAG: DNA alkylation repair protein [Firmicutes bacterium]|nr:DNA alkylation repair protein [Bacillota bacterium]
MITEDIRERLFALQDIKYRDFQAKLIPGKTADVMIGVRTPELRKLAKEFAKDPQIGDFLADLPHRYFDEDQLHAFIISGMKDYDQCMAETEKFLPYVDNWATCDQMSPKVFKKHRPALAIQADKWLDSPETYTIRFGIGMLMEHFLDEDFDCKYLERVADLRSEEYYVNMMIAWYFATALAKQWKAAIPYIENKRLDKWTHNKAIQKSIESYRITDEQKDYLRTLKIK